MNVGEVAKRVLAGALLTALPLLLSSPADARSYRASPLYDSQSPAQAWPSARTRYGRRPQPRTGIPADIPLPPRRPAEFAAPAPRGPQAPAPSQTSDAAPPPGDDAETCAAVLASGNVIAERAPAIHEGACIIEHPLMLKAIVLAEKRQIRLEPPVAMRCRLAGTIAQWIIEDVVPAIAEAGKPLEALSGVGAYECRGRNGVAGARLSEHAIGNAFDIAGLKLAGGQVISVQEQHDIQLFDRIRVSACARFATVLGPGADASHKTHLHVDLQERRGGYKMCQWDVAPSAPAPQQPAAPETAAKKN